MMNDYDKFFEPIDSIPPDIVVTEEIEPEFVKGIIEVDKSLAAIEALLKGEA